MFCGFGAQEGTLRNNTRLPNYKRSTYQTILWVKNDPLFCKQDLDNYLGTKDKFGSFVEKLHIKENIISSKCILDKKNYQKI